ncbi:Histidine phosphatase superfamily (branch 1) [Rubripirellula lacrimiformis]|uniref:Histidine phosphatase superfamily (Branch 1) n=1 Tax=Rubripirellula lacrimiformis TaxID=1930273 RepID=A0A517N5E5_9BACT|nr:histidine phosphatase family protein [Rubripirellula lacrimiformis]QDT02360.1 Histidine phosphatase superfamily (branch 1) [Rubripirellula lacrimiformis]
MPKKSDLFPHLNPATAARSKFMGCLLAVAGMLFAANAAQAELKIYYIRHAEGGHNVTQDWADVPKEQWPAYVGNPNMFTPKGEGQVRQATEKLQQYHFDFIAVSPMWRARNTVLPYLQATDARAQVWPELHEMYASHLILTPDLPKPTVKILGAGKLIEVPAEETPYMELRKDGMHKFKLPLFAKDHADMEGEAAAARVILQAAVDRIQKRFGGTDQSILLVGHGSSGKGLMRMLTGNRQSGLREGLENAGIWMVAQQPDGTFELKMYNDQPVVNGKLVPAIPQ